MNRRRLATLAATALALATASVLVAAPAHAAPWDGSDIVFGPGEWDADYFDFRMEDVAIVFDDLSTVNTDVWDGAGETTISASALGFSNEDVFCDTAADVDVQIDAGTGDLVYTCAADEAAFATAELAVVSEIRVLVGGQAVRFMTTITNAGDEDATIDAVDVLTDFGTPGELWDYENQDDGILPVPAAEGPDFAAALNLAQAQWIVHWEEDDAPGGLVIGEIGADVPASWTLTDGDEYSYGVGEFTIPPGESRSVVTFATLELDSLREGGFDNSGDDPSILNESAANIVEAMDDFSGLDGVLRNGIADVTTVINWDAQPAVAPEPEPEPELADTGATDVAGWGFGAVLLFAVGGLLIARRRAAA